MGTDGPKVGSKVQCAKCGTEVVVVKAPKEPIKCCGEPMGAPKAKEAASG
jgi:ribosomal protein S27E